MKADWWGPTNSSSTSLSRFTKMFEIFFTSTLHNEIGLNSSKTSGLSTLGISSRKVELTCFNSFPLRKKFDTALHTSCLMIPQQTWKKWALNPSGPGAFSGLKLSTTFSISSAATCRINPSYWSSVRTLSNFKLLFTLQDLICPKMFWKWETAAALMLVSALTMRPLSSLMERKVFRALLSGKAAHILSFYLHFSTTGPEISVS